MPPTERLNCWEYQGCERGPSGRRAVNGQRCPASLADSLDGVNGGRSGGRACWVVNDTLCNGRPSGPYEQKIHECRKCAFYARVHVEEALGVQTTEVLLERYCEE